MRAAFLIHGYLTDRDDFKRLAPLLSLRYDCVYSPDLPGHGGYREGGVKGKSRVKMKSGEITDFVLNTFDSLKEQYGTVDVFGYSMGGALAAFLACSREVGRLVLLAPANKFLSPGFPFARIRYNVRAARLQKNEKKGLPCDNDENLVSARDEMRVDSKSARAFLGNIFRSLSPGNLTEFNKVIKQCNSCLKPINAPVLILWGRLDQLVPRSALQYLVNYCRHPDTRTVIYGDISHLMLHSGAFYRIVGDILTFLDKTDPPKLDFTNK